ncbi:MAG: ferritin-like domain-containing protein [Pseudomonadota bacterium]|nr:ferritin-like domain-containing protein [Pseudomonadota bacterium]
MSTGAWSNLVEAAASCLLARDPAEKVRLTEKAAENWRAGLLDVADSEAVEPVVEPGRPERPELVHPRGLSKRSIKRLAGRAALIHAVAHIELNAINLAWDAVHRFRGLPSTYYDDWVRVAADEAYHFDLMRGRLRDLGFDYGDFPAHDGLWAMARRTAHDPLVRMALIPRVMEARGLDVTPGMIERFRSVGDEDTAARLEIILRDEVGHVAAGSRWFRHLCFERGLDPETTYFKLVDEYLHGEIRCPLNLSARLDAGFGEGELERLAALCAKQ